MTLTNKTCKITNVQQQETFYTVSQKIDTDVAHYNFNEHQPISVIFGRGAAGRV